MIRSRITRGLAVGTGALASGALIFAAAPAATATTTDGDTPPSSTACVGQRGERPFLGARLIPSQDGATVAHVVEGGPVDIAGIAEGDVVLTIDGVAIDQRSVLREALVTAVEGDEFAVVFTHDGVKESAVVTLGAPEDRPEKPAAEDMAWVGARLVASEDGVEQKLSVTLGSVADAGELRGGDERAGGDGTGAGRHAGDGERASHRDGEGNE